MSNQRVRNLIKEPKTLSPELPQLIEPIGLCGIDYRISPKQIAELKFREDMDFSYLPPYGGTTKSKASDFPKKDTFNLNIFYLPLWKYLFYLF